jgi:anti-sigma factor RsiW
MTSPVPVTDDELHAYLDGELPAERRPAVEAWLAAHPEDAARVAAWQTQAELIRGRYGGIAQEPVPLRLCLDRLSRRELIWTRVAAAAVALSFLTGALSGWFGRAVWDGAPVGVRTLTADAIDAYRIYTVEVRHPVEVPAADATHLVQWLSKRLGYDVLAPDLESIGLRLVGGRLLPGAGTGAAFLMYEGPSGERFTIYCVRADAPESALRYRAAGPVGAVYWIDDNKAYVVNGPADRDRLHKVAESAYGQIESRPPKSRT